MHFIRRFKSHAVVCALVLVAVGAAAPVASAGQSQRIDTAGGFASFAATDEILRVNDERKEGWRVFAELRDRDGAIPISGVADRDGANGEPWSNDLELAEGRDLSLRLCYERQLNTGAWIIVSCSGWQNAEA